VNSRHRRTLAAVFAKPILANIEWSAIEALLLAVGCRIVEGDGSRVRFERGGMVEVFHRPHPRKEAKPYVVRNAAAYTERLGVKP